MVLGNHLIKAWSKTQAVIAKSSAESELYGILKGSCEGLGACTLLRDLGVEGAKARMHVDASAAKGVLERKRLNKLRHMEADVLWIQDQMARWIVSLNNVAGTETIADLMTQILTA